MGLKINWITEEQFLRRDNKHRVFCPICGHDEIVNLFDFKPSWCECKEKIFCRNREVPQGNRDRGESDK
jgi:hypothetical protein